MTSWLIDKAAYVHLQAGHAVEQESWDLRIERGLVRLCTVTLLEIGYSARSGSYYRNAMNNPPLSYMPLEYVTPRAEKRAVDIQILLSEQGLHRAPSVPDLLIAAVAESSNLTVLTVDKDFDLISSITDQPVEQLELKHT